jgi:prepilin-type N-terminal cleavage/methylation domain-containing protein
MKKDFFGGFTLIEITAVAAIISALSAGTYLGVQKGRETECLNNLKQIYQAVTMFEMDNGTMPPAKFFPSSEADTRGIHRLLAQYGPRGSTMFCPSLPEQLNKYGTNYIWNDTLSGKNSGVVPASTWLMTEMTTVNKKISAPHMGGFAVLYVGGHAKVGQRVNLPEVTAPEPKPEVKKTEVKETEEELFPQQKLKKGLNILGQKEVVAGEKVKFSVFMSDADGKTATIKPGVLEITYAPSSADIPDSLQVKEDSPSVDFTAVFYKAGEATIKVRDEKTGDEDIYKTNVSPGPFHHFDFSDFPSEWEAGRPQKIRIVLLDNWNNRVDLEGDIVFYAVDGGLPSPEKVRVIDGLWEGEMILRTFSAKNIIYVSGIGMVSTSPVFTVKHSAPSSLEIISDKEAVAGVSCEIAIKVKDPYGNLCTGYTGNFNIDIPEGAVSDMENIVMALEDAGVKKNNITFFKAGIKKIQIHSNDIKGEKEIHVNPGALSEFTIREINEQEAGKPFDIIVKSIDKWGNQVKGFYLKDSSGTVEYVNRDFTAGVWMETVVITKSGEHMIVVEDSVGHLGHSNKFFVKPSAPVKLEIDGIPVPMLKGQEYSGEVMIKDRFENKIVGYAGEFDIGTSEGLKAELISKEGKTLRIDLKPEKSGFYKLTLRDKNNKDLSAEQNVVVTDKK